MSFLSVGTLAIDSVETPFAKRDRAIGGTNSFIALAASFFVRPVQLVSVIGGDFPEEFLAELREREVDLAGVQVRPDEKSFFWAGKYHDDMNGRDTLDTQLNVLADFDPVVPASYRDAEFLMLGNLTPSVQLRVLEQMSKRPKLVALDTMNFWMDSALDDLLKVIKRVDILIVNDEEARQLSGERSLVKAAQHILRLGVPYLVIKKGEHGALLFHDDKTFFAPALPLAEVFDPTGAGDTFAGGFMGYLASVGEVTFDAMKRAVIFGSALASYTCEDFGPDRLLEISRSDVDMRAGQFLELVRFDLDQHTWALGNGER